MCSIEGMVAQRGSAFVVAFSFLQIACWALGHHTLQSDVQQLQTAHLTPVDVRSRSTTAPLFCRSHLLSHARDAYCRCRQGAAGGGGAPPEWGPGSGGGCVQWAGKHCRLGSCPSCSPPRPLCRSTHLTVPCSRHLQVLCVKACQSMHKLDMGYKL